MEEKNITVTLEKAKEWYNSDNTTLKEIALQAFSEEKLQTFNFTKIKTFNDALSTLYSPHSDDYESILITLNTLKDMSKASAAMFKLNIIRKALNKDYNLNLIKNIKGQEFSWYPILRFTTKNSTFYNKELKDNFYEKIGKITYKGVIYDVIGGNADIGNYVGIGSFHSNIGVGYVKSDLGLLGCATEDIAKHFGKYFGMLIIEAMYGDMVDFKCIIK